MSSTRSSITAVPSISHIYLSNSDNNPIDLEKKPSLPQSNPLTFHNNDDTDDINTARKTRFSSLKSRLRSFRVKVHNLFIL